jgi:hypothetical protein
MSDLVHVNDAREEEIRGHNILARFNAEKAMRDWLVQRVHKIFSEWVEGC